MFLVGELGIGDDQVVQSRVAAGGEEGVGGHNLKRDKACLGLCH